MDGNGGLRHPSDNLPLSAAHGVESRTVNWYLEEFRKYAVFRTLLFAIEGVNQ